MNMPRLTDMIPEIKKGTLGGKTAAMGRRPGHRGEIETFKSGNQEDILRNRNLIKIPDDKTIYVVSPGGFGRDHYDEIPKDAFVIVVNYAIRIPAYCRENGIRELKPTIWLCADRNLATAPECHWFIEELQAIIDADYPIGVKDIRAGGPIVPVFDSGFLGGIFQSVRVIFSHGKSIVRKQPQPIPGKLRGGLTISCQAVQLAYWLGAKRVVICGIDMYGDDYFDDRKTNVSSRHDRIWSQISHFNRFVKWLKLNEVEVVSLSRTAISVQQPEDGPEIKAMPVTANPRVKNRRAISRRTRPKRRTGRKPRRHLG